MSITTLNIFNQFIMRQYHNLVQIFIDQDILHDAYIIAYHITLRDKKPYISSDECLELIKKAYKRSNNKELDYQFKFVKPEQMFWELNQQTDNQPATHEQDDAISLQEIRALRAKLNTLQRKVFDLYIADYDIKQIAKITGLTQNKINKIINQIKKIK